MDKKKVLIITGAVVVAALAFVALFWNQGAAERSQKKLDLAAKYISENKYQQAILAYNEVINIDPKQVKAYEGLAKVYTLQGKYEDAKDTYDQGIKAVDQSNRITLQLGLGGLYIDQGQMEAAEKQFQQIMDGNAKCIEAYWGLAMVYKQKGDIDKAESLLREAIKVNPNEYRAYNALALYLEENNRQQEALDNLVKSLSLQLNQQEAYLVLSDLYKNNWSDLRTRSQGISDPKAAAMLEFFSYYGGENYQEAINCYNEKLSQQSGNIKAQILAATAMVKTGDKAAAEELIKMALGQEVDGWLKSDLARYYLAAGDKEKAKAAAFEALYANPTNLDAVSVLQILGDESGKLYAAEYLLYNWKPLAEVKQDLARAEIRVSPLAPDADLITFLRQKHPDMSVEYLQCFDKIVADITGDDQDEIIVSYPWNGGKAFVLQPQGDSYKILEEYDNNYGSAVVDKYGDLVLTIGGDGTGCVSYDNWIVRWDGHKLRKIWSGKIKNELYNMDSVEITKEKGTYTISGDKNPEKLRYVFTGHNEEKPENIVKEYRFDQDQFKFVEVSSEAKPEESSLKSGNLPDSLFTFKGVSVGMSEQQVNGLVGDPPSKGNVDEDHYIWEYTGGNDGFRIIFSNSSHRVVTMWLMTNDAGIKYGDPCEKITNAYGPGQIEPYKDGYTLLRYQQDKSRRVTFVTYQGTVWGVWVDDGTGQHCQ